MTLLQARQRTSRAASSSASAIEGIDEAYCKHQHTPVGNAAIRAWLGLAHEETFEITGVTQITGAKSKANGKHQPTPQR